MANKPEVSNRFLARWGREAILFYTIELNCTQRARDCYASLALAGWFAMQVNTVEETYIYNLSSSSSSHVQFLLAIAKKIDSIFFLLQIIRKECETCAERSAKCRKKEQVVRPSRPHKGTNIQHSKDGISSSYIERVTILQQSNNSFFKKKSSFLSIRLDESYASCWSFVYQNSVGRHQVFFLFLIHVTKIPWQGLYFLSFLKFLSQVFFKRFIVLFIFLSHVLLVIES